MSILQCIFDCLKSVSGAGNDRQNHYRYDEIKSIVFKPKTHLACRSSEENNLKPYQSNIDGQRSLTTIYVSSPNINLIYLLFYIRTSISIFFFINAYKQYKKI
jgi:hypothetical protein